MSDPSPPVPVVTASTWTDPVFWVTTIGAIAAGIVGTGVLGNWTMTFSTTVKLWVTPLSYVIAFAFMMTFAIHAHLTAKQILALVEQWFSGINPTPAVSTGGVKVSSATKRYREPTGAVAQQPMVSWDSQNFPQAQSTATYMGTISGFQGTSPKPPEEPEPPAAVPAA